MFWTLFYHPSDPLPGFILGPCVSSSFWLALLASCSSGAGHARMHYSVADLCLVRLSGLLFKRKVLWVPHGNPAGNLRANFRPIFCQTWLPNPSRSTGLVLQCRLHHKSAAHGTTKTGQIALKYPGVLAKPLCIATKSANCGTGSSTNLCVLGTLAATW